MSARQHNAQDLDQIAEDLRAVAHKLTRITEQLEVLCNGHLDKSETVSRIVDLVCDHYGVSKVRLVSRSRLKIVDTARHVALYLARKKTTLSTPKIGALLCRDHGSVCHSTKTVEDWMETDKAFLAEVHKLEAQLNGEP